MPDLIHVLSDAVANQIAAGEVIQRPASVVKELVENCVDAGATSVRIMIKDAGKTLIQLVDNGVGMSASDSRLCFERHATSKITAAEDLFSIRTKGFRGEALASIAAVAEVELKTRQKGDELGTRILISASRIESQEPVQTSPGTSIQVRNLFFNIPARRKFLKADHTELRYIIQEFNHIALTHCEIEFLLVHNQTEILHLPPSNLKQRIINTFGKSLSNHLIPLETRTSIVHISGFIGKPEHARTKYGEQFFFVNNRYVKHPYLHKAVMSGYEKIIAPDHIPSYFIYLESDPATIDVNIHPSKTEVKFEDEKSVWQILLASVREAIGRNNLSPSMDFSREGVIDIPVLTKTTNVQVPLIETNPDYDPFSEESGYRRANHGSSDYFRRWDTAGSPGTPDRTIRDFTADHWEQLFEPAGEPVAPVNKYLQIKNKYILSPVKSGVMIIDQRRAHERILYENLVRTRENRESIAQQTLFPETIRFNPADYQVCKEIMPWLEKIGFDVRELGHHTLVIHGIPAEMSVTGARDKLEKIVEHYKSLETVPETELFEELIRATAVAGALDYGKRLSNDEIQELVDKLFACTNPHFSPSGKPVVKIIDLESLDVHFKV
jgi:DNA mismatch repair protein MutL